jgi:hypothetical protein
MPQDNAINCWINHLHADAAMAGYQGTHLHADAGMAGYQRRPNRCDHLQPSYGSAGLDMKGGDQRSSYSGISN